MRGDVLAAGVSGLAAGAGLLVLALGRRDRLGYAVVQVGKKKIPERFLVNPKVPRGLRFRLTPSQFARLFPGLRDLPRDVWPTARCGIWGCVYPRGPAGTPEGRQVVKFTADPDEAEAARRLAWSPVPGTLPVLDVQKIRGTVAPVFAIVAQRFAAPGELARVVGHCSRPFVIWRLKGDPTDFERFTGCVEAHAIRARVDRAKAFDFTGKLVKAVAGLARRGIVWTDLHAGNVTQDEAGDPIILDVGPYRVRPTVEPAPIPELAG
jgi:hypothetical protein